MPTPESTVSIELYGEKVFNQGTRIKVIGVGGGGGNAVAHMIDCAVQGVEFICANTDAQALSSIPAHRIIQLGTTGLGAGSKPDQGQAAAELAIDEIKEAIDGAHMLFITAGMGGGTGTGAAPVIARIAREKGILTVGVITKPFGFEGKLRMSNANEGLKELEANVDSLIVVLNDKLQEVLGDDVLQHEAFAHANDVLKNAVGGIAEIINVKALVNVDFEDVRTILGEPGKAMMGTATASGPDRARIAAEQAVVCPLLEGVDMKGAKGVVVLITASRSSLKLSETKLAMETISSYASPDAHVIYGSANDEKLGDLIRVTVIATGLNRPCVQTKPVLTTSQTQEIRVRPALNDDPIQRHGTSSVHPLTSRGTNTPMPWRKHHDRLQSASPVEAVSSGSADDFSIPAFLRRKID